jgi:hypothetical protein
VTADELLLLILGLLMAHAQPPIGHIAVEAGRLTVLDLDGNPLGLEILVRSATKRRGMTHA